MPYGECKIYSDGGHYIAIPHTTNPNRRRKKPPEEEITVIDEEENGALSDDGNTPVSPAKDTSDEVSEPANTAPQNDDTGVKTGRKMTRKELFEELYAANLSAKKWKRRKLIISAMVEYWCISSKRRRYGFGDGIVLSTKLNNKKRGKQDEKKNIEYHNMFDYKSFSI